MLNILQPAIPSTTTPTTARLDARNDLVSGVADSSWITRWVPCDTCFAEPASSYVGFSRSSKRSSPWWTCAWYMCLVHREVCIADVLSLAVGQLPHCRCFCHTFPFAQHAHALNGRRESACVTATLQTTHSTCLNNILGVARKGLKNEQKTEESPRI